MEIAPLFLLPRPECTHGSQPSAPRMRLRNQVPKGPPPQGPCLGFDRIWTRPRHDPSWLVFAGIHHTDKRT
jgi:hypothetical protein